MEYITKTVTYNYFVKSLVLQLRLEILPNFYLILFLPYSLLFSNLIFLKSRVQRTSHLGVVTIEFFSHMLNGIIL